MNKKITELRLQKEEQSLEKQPHPQALVTRIDFLNFHFCLFGLEEDFAKGFYHGVLQLPEDYPFAPPKIRFLTENGRFEVGKPICTTFTHYHKETWSSSWNIKTILTGLISFMYTNEKGIGGVFQSSARRKTLAKKSLANNLGNPLFIKLFKQKLIAREIVSEKEIEEIIRKNNEKEAKLSKMKKQNLSCAQFRLQEQELMGEKDVRQMLLKVGEEQLKVVAELKNVLNDNIEEMSSRKKLHFQQDEIIFPILDRNFTQQEENRQLQ